MQRMFRSFFQKRSLPNITCRIIMESICFNDSLWCNGFGYFRKYDSYHNQSHFTSGFGLKL